MNVVMTNKAPTTEKMEDTLSAVSIAWASPCGIDLVMVTGGVSTTPMPWYGAADTTFSEDWRVAGHGGLYEPDPDGRHRAKQVEER